jgi:outer membrane protease
MSCVIIRERYTPTLNKFIKVNLHTLTLIFAIFPAALFAQTPESARDLMISKTLDIIETHKDLEPPKNNYNEQEKQETHLDGGYKDFMNDPVYYLLGSRGYFTLGLLSGYINGRTRYHIQFDYDYSAGGHVESELNWPLSNSLIGLITSLNYRLTENPDETRDRARLELAWFMRRIDKSAGKIEDSDWFENDVGYLGGGSNNSGKDIYSESNAKLDDVRLIDASYIYNFWLQNDFAIGPRLGVRAQKFNFSAYDLDEVGYGSYDLVGYTYRDTRGRKWLEYRANYSIPYFGLGSEYRLKDNLNLLFSFGYSPWVHIKDVDTHLYPDYDETYGINRDMLSEGHCDGHAYLWGVRGAWRITPDWLLNIGGSYVDLEASGNMIQKVYHDGALYSISNPIGERITSEYWLADLSLSFIF